MCIDSLSPFLHRYALSSVQYYEEILPGQTETDMRGRLLAVTALIGDVRFGLFSIFCAHFLLLHSVC